MDVAADLVREGAREGVVVVADEQTAGRGRLGRTWSSPPGAGLYLSLVLRPPHDAERRVVSLVTLMAGVAVHAAVHEATGLVTELKWPNDVMVGRRKLAGILAEGSALGTPEQAVVVGIGINVLRSSHPPDVADRATSIEEELGRPADREALVETVLAAIASRYTRLRDGDGDGILRAWRAAAPSAVGARVQMVDGGKQGVTAGVDTAGALLVEMGQGIERVIAGELRWL
jgi:BirA family biotin operon repressor/biotin-[acetyl-CoA-carboxylase] ligase